LKTDLAIVANRYLNTVGPQTPIYPLFGAVFAITREPLKLRRQVRYCKKDF